LSGFLGVLDDQIRVPDVVSVKVVLDRAFALAFILFQCSETPLVLFDARPAFLLGLERFGFELPFGLGDRLATPGLEITFFAVDLVFLVPQMLVVREALGLGGGLKAVLEIRRFCGMGLLQVEDLGFMGILKGLFLFPLEAVLFRQFLAR
jgi:hypothetical protein